MRPLLILCACLLLAFPASAGHMTYAEFGELYASAVRAEQAGEYDRALELANRTLAVVPSHPFIHFRLAGIHARRGDTAEALAALTRALELGLDFGEELPEHLRSLAESPGFNRVRPLIDAMRRPVSTSEVAVTLPAADWIPEGLAWDPVDACFYMGGIWSCNIVRFDLEGNATDFTERKQDGLRAVLGLRVDAKRRVLWAVSEVSGPRPDIDAGELGWSGLFAYDLRTGELLAKHEMFAEGERHLFNDIALTAAGDVFVSDSEFGAVYRLPAGGDDLELFIRSDALYYPNGITVGGDDNTLYLAAEGNGVFRIDIAARSLAPVAVPEGVTHIGFDGLYCHEGDLVGVQNGLGRIARLRLDPPGNAVISIDVLETRNPHFDIPTTGAVVGDAFYYIANSQMTRFDEEGRALPVDRLNDTVILKTALD